MLVYGMIAAWLDVPVEGVGIQGPNPYVGRERWWHVPIVFPLTTATAVHALG